MLSVDSKTRFLSIVFISFLLLGCGSDSSHPEAKAYKTSDNLETTEDSQSAEGTDPTENSNSAEDAISVEGSSLAEKVISDVESEGAPDNSQGLIASNDQEVFNWDTISGWHTNGIVSNDSPIQIQFNRDVVSDDLIGEDASKVMFISPSIKGKPVFESKSRISWKMDEPLKAGTIYKVNIKPHDFKDVPSNTPAYKFSFRVIPLEFQIKTHGLESINKSDSMNLKGTLLVSDKIDDEAAEKILKASLQGQPLTIEWVHGSNGKQHHFTVRDIKRDSFESSLYLKWDGKNVNIDDKGEKEISIPSINTFEVSNIEVIRTAGRNPYVEVRFSDELDPKQNFKGLVELKKSRFTYKVSRNVINIFPRTNITGRYVVKIHEGIKTKTGNKVIAESVEQKLKFYNVKPEVKFVSKGTILPPNSTLEIPFDAVGVNAVEVTAFKVFKDNISHFLQNNRLSGSEQIKRNGRYLWRKTIPLNPANPNQWNRYSFDAAELMKAHSGGLLRLTLSIKSKHSTYNCPSHTPASTTKSGPLTNWEDFNVSEASGWDGISDYAENSNYDYEWDDRNNPCTDSYFKHFDGKTNSSQNFIASNIGLITKQEADGTLNIISTDIRTAKPLTDTEFEVQNFQGQTLGTAKSDGSGFAQIKLSDTPFLLIAKKFEDTAYLKLNAKTALSMSHFNIGGDKIKKGIKGFIYGERGVWRPGDDIFLTFVLQHQQSTNDKSKKLPNNHPVTMKLIDPRGQVVKTKTSTDSIGGFYAFKFKTAEKAQTGNWQVKAYVGGSQFTKPIMIETVRPNRLRLELSFNNDNSNSDKETEVIYKSDGEMNGTLFSQWLHGATANKLKADISVRFSQKKTKFDSYTDYVFDDPARQLRSGDHMLLSGRLDNKGFLRFNKTLSVDGEPAGLLKAKFTSRVFEDGGAFSISRQKVDYHPYENYVGIKLPKGDETRGMLLTDIQHNVKLASLSAKGEKVSLDKVEVSLYKIHWKWWWDKSSDSLAQYADSKHHKLLQQATVNTTDGNGEWNFQIKYPEWGRYLIRACDLDGQHCTGKTVYIDWPGWAGRAQEEGSGAASRLNLFSDKPAYNVGETATIQLPAAAQGRALLTVETGSQILEQRWVDFEKAPTTEGDTSGREERKQFKLTITENMAPNVYIHMTLLQPHVGKSNDRPIRLYGVIPLEVSNPETYLSPLIQASEEWQPETKQIIKVSEKNGLAMNYTLAVVDEGLLGLTSFRTPNLHRHFYSKEALGIKTWDLFDDVIGAYGGKLERMLALGGGDGDDGDDDDSKKRRFPPVVKYIGPFNLKAGETAEHEVKLPPYLGAVRLMLVAGDSSKAMSAYGKTQKSVFVRQPLMLQASLPRVLGPNEEVSVPLSLFIMDDTIKSINLSLQTNDLVHSVAQNTQQIAVTETGEKTVFLKVKTGDKAGKAHLKFTATAGENGEHKSTKEVYLDIRRANKKTTRTVSKVIAPNTTWENQSDAFGIAGTNQKVLELSSVPALNLHKHLNYLTRYPHGCLEQTTSAVFPQLYLSNLMRLNETQQQNTQHHVLKAIDKLQRFQLSSGDFSYWPGGSYNNPWASIYAGHFLIEAQKSGYLVTDSVIRKWLSFQTSAAQQYVAGNGKYSHIQAYRLYVLAFAGKPQLGAMNRLREAANASTESLSKLNTKARWLLASAYQKASQPQAAQALIQGISTDVENVQRSDRSFSSTLGNLGLKLESLVALDRKEDANYLVEQIADEMQSGVRQNTQGIAWALMSVSKYLAGDTSNFTATINEAGISTSITSEKPLSSSRIVDPSAKVSVENTSNIRLFANMISQGVPSAGKEISQNKGLSLSVSFDSRDDDNKKHWNTLLDQSNWKIQQGNDARINVTIKNTLKYNIENIALTIPAAAGMEVLNSSEKNSKQSKFDHKDLRDDRIHYYFSLKKGETKTFSLLANASFLGNYYQPAINAEAMYDGNIKASAKGRWLNIAKNIEKSEVKPKTAVTTGVADAAESAQ